MKTLMLGMILMTVNAVAAEVKIYEESAHYGDAIGGSFGVNEEMGRAWVELSISDRMPEPNISYEKIKVEGLSLQGDSVVLEVDGQAVECAKVRPVGIFRTRMARATGNCKFKTRTGSVILDDGFETRKVPTSIVYLITK